MDECLMCQGYVDIDEEVLNDDGVSTDIFYICEDCGAYFVEHSFVEILDEGRVVA